MKMIRTKRGPVSKKKRYHCLLCKRHKPFWNLAQHHKRWHADQEKDCVPCTGTNCKLCVAFNLEKPSK